jgi:hypothetical protein
MRSNRILTPSTGKVKVASRKWLRAEEHSRPFFFFRDCFSLLGLVWVSMNRQTIRLVSLLWAL